MIDTAAGIHDVVNQNMAAAASMHGVEMGMDLRGIPVIAFGGAGRFMPAVWLSCSNPDEVIFPVNASVLSAFGTLVSPCESTSPPHAPSNQLRCPRGTRPTTRRASRRRAPRAARCGGAR